jgi:hypothetical protein
MILIDVEPVLKRWAELYSGPLYYPKYFIDDLLKEPTLQINEKYFEEQKEVKRYMYKGIAITSKTPDEEVWVTGDLIVRGIDYSIHPRPVDGITINPQEKDGTLMLVPIFPETASRYTEMKDKFGHPIFENDLLGHPGNNVEYSDGEFNVAGDRPLWALAPHYEVVGNLYDGYSRKQKEVKS